jgi:hypothetical protein
LREFSFGHARQLESVLRAQPTRRRLTPTPPTHRPEHSIRWKSWTDQRLQRASAPPDMITRKPRSPPQLFRGLGLNPVHGAGVMPLVVRGLLPISLGAGQRHTCG